MERESKGGGGKNSHTQISRPRQREARGREETPHTLSTKKIATTLTNEKPLEQGEGETTGVEKNQEEPREQGSSMREREKRTRRAGEEGRERLRKPR